MSQQNNTMGAIYRLISPNDWEAAQVCGYIAKGPADERFIHLSFEEQVLVTANLYFAQHEQILAVQLNAEKLGDALQLEAVVQRDGALFPHLYAETIDCSWLMATRRLVRRAGAGFAWVEESSLVEKDR